MDEQVDDNGIDVVAKSGIKVFATNKILIATAISVGAVIIISGIYFIFPKIQSSDAPEKTDVTNLEPMERSKSLITNNKTGNNNLLEEEPYIDSRNGFSIQPPKMWWYHPPFEDDASYIKVYFSNEEYLTSSIEINVSMGELRSYTFDSWVESFRKFGKTFAWVETTRDEETTIDGHRVVILRINSKVSNDSEIKTDLFFLIEGAEEAASVIATGPVKSWDKYGEAIEASLRTFRFIPKIAAMAESKSLIFYGFTPSRDVDTTKDFRCIRTTDLFKKIQPNDYVAGVADDIIMQRDAYLFGDSFLIIKNKLYLLFDGASANDEKIYNNGKTAGCSWIYTGTLGPLNLTRDEAIDVVEEEVNKKLLCEQKALPPESIGVICDAKGVPISN